VSNVVEELEEIEFEIPLEDEYEDRIEENKRNIFTDKSDPEIESLINRIKRGSLILQPDFQRYYVWDKVKASRLIESTLLDIPLPVVYLSEENDGKTYVIDGQQRLTSFVSFYDGHLPDGNVFKLSGLKIFEELNNKTFSDLDNVTQEKILLSSIRTITFKKESEKDLKFEIFERLNTGAVALNDQELRNCIYRGHYNKLLKFSSENPDFKFLTGITKPDKRMKDIELVLRFAAFYHQTYLRYKPPMKKFLNNEMEMYQNISANDATDLENAFKNAVSIIKSVFGKRAFKRYYIGESNNVNGRWETKKFNASLYDVLMNSFATADKNIVYQHLDEIVEELIYVMTENQDFIDSIELSTSSIQAVTKRFDIWRMSLQSIIGINNSETRCFLKDFKKSLYDNNPVCVICGNQINDLDDAAVDHIEQYWKGGKTIPENARLTHRYCNCSRLRND
jgi:hypothetical protein